VPFPAVDAEGNTRFVAPHIHPLLDPMRSEKGCKDKATMRGLLPMLTMYLAAASPQPAPPQATAPATPGKSTHGAQWPPEQHPPTATP
jgi:hypothetical protein